MPSCVFRKCTNYTATVRNRTDISFHTLPKNGLIREKWIKKIRTQRREDDWMPSTFTQVCSKHFLVSDLYATKKNTCRLKKSAIPVIDNEETRNVSSPTSLDDVYISDEDSIFDTPTKNYFKAEVAKLFEEKRKLQMKNSNLVRKNKRLIAKCERLQNIVLQLGGIKVFEWGSIKRGTTESGSIRIDSSIDSEKQS